MSRQLDFCECGHFRYDHDHPGHYGCTQRRCSCPGFELRKEGPESVTPAPIAPSAGTASKSRSLVEGYFT